MQKQKRPKRHWPEQWPPVRKSFDADASAVGCGRVYGLLLRHDVAVGPYGNRGPSPSLRRVAMPCRQRRVALDCRIDRHCHHAGSPSQTSDGRCRRFGPLLAYCSRKAPRNRGRCRCFRKIASPECWRTPRSSNVELSQLQLRRPRQWGACWRALMLWRAQCLGRSAGRGRRAGREETDPNGGNPRFWLRQLAVSAGCYLADI
jgi:hypothetical protein